MIDEIIKNGCHYRTYPTEVVNDFAFGIYFDICSILSNFAFEKSIDYLNLSKKIQIAKAKFIHR